MLRVFSAKVLRKEMSWEEQITNGSVENPRVLNAR